MNNHNIRCVILDDEYLAGKLISSYVEKINGLNLLLRTTSSQEVIDFLQHQQADLLLLDVQMPEQSGIDLMKQLSHLPLKIILITAYAEYALEGYEYNVIDYLLKPVTFERFRLAIEKAKERIALQGTVPDFLFIKTEYRHQKVAFSDILYIEGLRDYFAVHTKNGKILSLERMKNILRVLPGQTFLKIHKSYIINITHIDFIEKGRIVINKTYLPVGETFKAEVYARLNIR